MEISVSDDLGESVGRSSETLIRQGAKMRGCAAAAATANHAVCVWVV
ncbi:MULTISPECIES: hypothetical protein [Neisseria]|uniref:Uncharacterized protein n=1 Tax=Neisseria macacae ATCC 33926 TaxID=997348 RepID=A0ABY3Y839_9NEIS|nr:MULTISPECIES: hypothetical protein [Neisseria]UNV85118.1 hypothetical protein MON40_00870 [Neisseria macacae ATCC 33926]